MRKKTKEQKINKVNWLKIKHGDDLLEAITQHCLKNRITKGLIIAIGALQKAKFSYYKQKEKRFCLKKSFAKPVEIISCLGNVSLKDGKPFVHAHLALADQQGRVFGGHLTEGCLVFACECAVFELKGDLLERRFDKLTGLFLWDFTR